MSEVNLAEMEIRIKSLVQNACQISGFTIKAKTDANDIFTVSIDLKDDMMSYTYDPYVTYDGASPVA